MFLFGAVLILPCLDLRLAFSNDSTHDMKPRSKKGLQVEWVEDALELGIDHAGINVNLSSLIQPAPEADSIAWVYRDQTFHFRRSYVEHLDRQIAPLSKHKVAIYLILLVYETNEPDIRKILIHPKYSSEAPNRLSAFNVSNEQSRAWLAACIDFMAHRWSGQNDAGLIDGWIVGNEVNSHWWWSNMGPIDMHSFANEYAEVVRTVYQASQSQLPASRVYLSLEHHWSIRYPAGNEQQSFAARPFLEYFSEIIRRDGDFPWHVAFHPYPENLFEPRFWNDVSAVASLDSPRITFRNLSVLTDFLNQPSLLFEGYARRVILSEQGFHTPDGPDGETIQAAAYCLAYRLVDANPQIDAFILHRHIDHPNEGGLLLGLLRRSEAPEKPHPRKKIYDVFRDANQPEWQKTFEPYLQSLEMADWSSDSIEKRISHPSNDQSSK